jgi:sugar lactone lactonase YvrE
MASFPLPARIAAVLFLTLSSSLFAQNYTFTRLAGSAGGPGATDGAGAGARFSAPWALVGDDSGIVYVADTENHVIRKVSISGEVTTLAGMAGEPGHANGFGAAARFNRPAGMTLDPSGNLYVSDQNHVIRRITPGGLVTAFAGGSFGPDNLFLIFGLASDSAGNIYAAQYGNHTIRKITPAGVITTLAGLADSPGTADGTGSAARFERPNAVAVDSSGNVFVTELVNNTIRKITPAGVVTTIAGAPGPCGWVDATGTAARFCGPRGAVFDSSGNLIIADGSNFRIRKIELGTGAVTTLAGDGFTGSIDGNGTSARFANVQGVGRGPFGTLYVAEGSGHTVRKIDFSANVTTLAGLAPQIGSTVASGTDARFTSPTDTAIDSSGNIYISDTPNRTIRRINAGSTTPNVFVGVVGSNDEIDGDVTTARFATPGGLTSDSSNNLYVADRNSCTVRKITPAGDVSTLAGLKYTPGSDNGTGSAARFNNPGDVAADAAGNVYVADTGNHTIRKITPAGVVTTLAGLAGFTGSTDATGSAARFTNPSSLAVGSDGNLYVCDQGNHTIRKVTMAGVVTTLAGSPGQEGGTDGTGTDARLRYPIAIAADGSGNLYLTSYGWTVRRVTLAGVVTTIGGRHETVGTEDGTGSVARFSFMGGIASTSAGILYLVDGYAIRRGAGALPDQATATPAEGAVGVLRQLSTSSPTANIWAWSLVRRPSGSSATLSSTNIRTPTFTPDKPDLFTFRLTAALGASMSITEVSVVATGDDILTLGPASLPPGVRTLNYSTTLTASGGVAPYHFALTGGSLPPGTTLSSAGILSGTLTTAGTFNFDVMATDSAGAIGEHGFSVTVTAAAVAVEAHAVTATSVDLTWAAVNGATSYKVYRSPLPNSYSLVGSSPTSSFTDTTAAPNTAYLYRITAVDAANHESQPGTSDLATTVIFTDPVLSSTTPVRASHLTQLRTAVNAVRTLALLGNAAFTDATLTGQVIKAVHTSELRTALAPARSSLGLAAITFTDPTLTSGVTKIKVTHAQQLRDGVQ